MAFGTHTTGIASSALVLSFNFVAAIACISLNKKAFVLFPFPAALVRCSPFRTLSCPRSRLLLTLPTPAVNRALSTLRHSPHQTFVHYLVSWGGIELLHRMGRFERQPVPPGHGRAFYALIVCWSACNALSNVSLAKNSVGFYQRARSPPL